MRTYLVFCGTWFILVSGSASSALDPYGGDTRLSVPNASGFFRVAKVEGRYWLITPAGNVFWSVGPTTVTGVGGQRTLGLAYIPDQLTLAVRYPGGVSEWRTRLFQRLDAWRNNTEGGFSNDISGPGGRKFPETFRVYFFTERHRARNGNMVAGNNFPDVFDEPTFTNAVNEFASTIAAYKDDPWRIGHYPDNEIDWSYRGKLLPTAFFEQDRTKPGKQYMVNTFLRNRYGGDIALLNSAWGTNYSSWDGAEPTSLISATVLPADTEVRPAIRADKIAFLRAVADKYFSTVTAVMRTHDPNHLVFSNRIGLFAGTFENHLDDYNRQVWEKAGQYCDIVAINSYQDHATFEAAFQYYSDVFRAAGKPILITEWSRAGNDSPITYKPWARPNQSRRAESAIQAAREAWDLRTNADPNDGQPASFVMGLHWFQLYDEPALGRFDGENWNTGMLNIFDEAYPVLLEPMADLWSQMYDVMIDGTPYLAPARPEVVGPRAGEIVTDPAPVLSWRTVPGAVAYDVLLSQSASFPDEQCLRWQGVVDSFVQPGPVLCSGAWFWCVRALGANGVGGLYSEPALFVVNAVSVADVTAAFGFETLAGWRTHPRGDSGGWGEVMAWADASMPSDGRAALRLEFTGLTKNRFNDAANIGAIGASQIPPGAASLSQVPSVADATGPYTGYPLAFSDDFDDGDADGWILPSGVWSVSSRVYRQTDTGSWGHRSSVPARIGDAEYIVDVRITSSVDAPNWAGIVINRQAIGDSNGDSGYLICFRRHGGAFIWNHVDGIAYDDPGVVSNTGVFNRLHVVAQGATLSVYINGTHWRTWTDPNARYAGGGFFALITGRAAAQFDNVQIYSRQFDPDAVDLRGQDLRFAWGGGVLDYRGVEDLALEVMPTRSALQDGSIAPSSRFLRLQLLDATGSAVLDRRVDPQGTLPIGQWTRVVFPLDAAVQERVSGFALVMNTGDFRFPLDQRLRVYLDAFTPPRGLSAGEPAALWPPFVDEFDRPHLEHWQPTGGEWGLVDGAAWGYGIRDSEPSCLLAANATIRHGTLSAMVRTRSNHIDRRVWIVFGYQRISHSFYFAGLDAVTGQWEVGSWDGFTLTVRARRTDIVRPDQDYRLDVLLTSAGVRLLVNGQQQVVWNQGNLAQGAFGIGMWYSHVAVQWFASSLPVTSIVELR